MKKRITNRGRSKPRKLEQSDINDIIDRLANGESLQSVAARYKVSQIMIQKIKAEQYTYWKADPENAGPQAGEHPADYLMRVLKKIEEKE